MRNIKELLELLLKEYTCPNDRPNKLAITNNGLCWAITILYIAQDITLDENYTLLNYMKTNIPVGIYGPMYWWRKGLREPRTQWLKEHIQLNS
jgi:hypothetical protein